MKEIESITFHFTIKKEGNLTEVCQFSYQRKTEENFDRNVIDRIFITSFSRFLSRPNEKWKSWNFIPSPREFRPISLATNCLQILSIYPYDLRSRKRDRREFRNLLRTVRMRTMDAGFTVIPYKNFFPLFFLLYLYISHFSIYHFTWIPRKFFPEKLRNFRYNLARFHNFYLLYTSYTMKIKMQNNLDHPFS